MPSGSHGGGGGSHFGGGGGFHSSGGGSHFEREPLVPRTFIFFGHSYYMSPGRQSAFSIIIFFIIASIMAMAFSGIVLGATASNINKIEEDYKYYIAMIDKAENDPSYKREAIVSDHFYNTDCGKYYYTYSIDKDYYVFPESSKLEGYTFSLYTLSEVNAYEIGSIVYVAVNSTTVTKTTDSIPMDFKYASINSDGEYIAEVATQNTSRVVLIMSVIVFAGLVGLSIYLFITARKKEESAVSGKETIDIKNKNKCPYCGTKINEQDAKCPSCGAPLQ